jgi:bacterioferritin-associated ferredoxin
MFICKCNGVTEKDIRHAVWSGARNMERVKLVTGATSGCGGCADSCKKLMEVTIERRKI